MKKHMADMVDLDLNLAKSKLQHDFANVLTKLATSLCIYHTQLDETDAKQLTILALEYDWDILTHLPLEKSTFLQFYNEHLGKDEDHYLKFTTKSTKRQYNKKAQTFSLILSHLFLLPQDHYYKAKSKAD